MDLQYTLEKFALQLKKSTPHALKRCQGISKDHENAL